MEFLTQPRIATFITFFLVTLSLYILRGVGLLSFLPGGVVLGSIALSLFTLVLALNPRRRFW
jgi:hypothetical protein